MDFGTDANYAWHFRKIRETIHSQRKTIGLGRRLELIQIQFFHCVACKSKLYGEPKELHVHHVVPLCLGGSNNNDNLVIICKNCHDHQHGKCPNMSYFENVNNWILKKYGKFNFNTLDFIPYRVIATRLFHHSHYKGVMPFA